MDMVDNILDHLKTNRETDAKAVPEGLCPVCWGYQQYDGKIRQLFQDKQVDVNNHHESYTLIQQFVKQHLDSITLRKGEVHSCPSCSTQEHG